MRGFTVTAKTPRTLNTHSQLRKVDVSHNVLFLPTQTVCVVAPNGNGDISSGRCLSNHVMIRGKVFRIVVYEAKT